MTSIQNSSIWKRSDGRWSRLWVLVGAIAVVAGIVALVNFIHIAAIKTSDDYREALARTRSHPRAIAALGSPIKDGIFVTGQSRQGGNVTTSLFTVPLSGPKGRGYLLVDSMDCAGDLEIRELVLELAAPGGRIDLLQETKNSDAGPISSAPPTP